MTNRKIPEIIQGDDNIIKLIIIVVLYEALVSVVCIIYCAHKMTTIKIKHHYYVDGDGRDKLL